MKGSVVNISFHLIIGASGVGVGPFGGRRTTMWAHGSDTHIMPLESTMIFVAIERSSLSKTTFFR